MTESRAAVGEQYRLALPPRVPHPQRTEVDRVILQMAALPATAAAASDICT